MCQLRNQESKQIDSKTLIGFSALSSIIIPLQNPYFLIFQYFNNVIRVDCIYIVYY